LKIVWARLCRVRCESSSPSTATVSVPISGPNSSTHENAKISETDSSTSIDGIFSVKNPVANVSSENAIHAGGTSVPKSASTDSETTAAPDTPTTPTRIRPPIGTAGRVSAATACYRPGSWAMLLPQTTYSVSSLLPQTTYSPSPSCIDEPHTT
jgi:hypothetical protein